MRSLRPSVADRDSVKYVGDDAVHSGLAGEIPGKGAYPYAARSTG
jgi:hypothetical protein